MVLAGLIAAGQYLLMGAKMKLSELRHRLRPYHDNIEIFVRDSCGRVVEVEKLTVLYRDPGLGLDGASSVVIEPRKEGVDSRSATREGPIR